MDIIGKILHLSKQTMPSLLTAAAANVTASLFSVLLMGSAAYIITSAAFHPPLYTLALAITVVRAAGLGRAVFRYLDRWLSHRAAFSLLAAMRSRCYALAEAALPLRSSGAGQGAWLMHLLSGMELWKDFFLRSLAPPLLGILLSLLALAVLWHSSPLAAMAVPAACLLNLSLPLLFLKTNPSVDSMETAYRELLLDLCEGKEDLPVQAKNAVMQQRLDSAVQRYQLAQQRQARHEHCIGMITSVGNQLAFFAIFCALLPQVLAGSLHLVTFSVYLLGTLAILSEFQALPEAARTLKKTVRTLQEMPELPAEEKKIAPAPKGARHETASSQDVPLLELREISFAYGKEPPVINGLSCSIERGKHYAILGESGAGKTTLFHLLLGIWPVDRGSILLDGKPYAEYDSHDLIRFFAASTQGGYLFSNSVRANFEMLCGESDEARILHALALAQVEHAILQMPGGLDAPLGENACRLSGGQRNRLLTALALCRPAPILLLDEPTAGLDRETAARLMEAIAQAAADRTLLVITHDALLLPQMEERQAKKILLHG